MTARIRVLLVEDSADDAELVTRALERGGYPADVTRVEDQESMSAALARGPWDLVIADHSLPRFSSTAAIATLRAVDEDIGCVIVSGSLGEEAAVQAMRAGADDYVLKDRLGGLGPAVERTFRTAQARRDRRRAEGRYRALVDSAPDGVVTADLQGILTALNPAFEVMCGVPVAAALGRHFSEFMHPEDAEAMTAGFAGALQAETPIRAQVRVLNRGGLYFHAELTVSRLLEGNEVVGLISVFRDVSERRTMERELRRSEGNLRTLVASAPDGIFTLSPTGEISAVNPALQQLLGRDHIRAGRHFRDLIHPDDLLRAYDIFSRRLRGEEIAPYELRLLHEDGHAIDVEITSAALTEGGRITGSLGIVRDITRRKRHAEELAQREERFRLVTQATQDAVYDWDLGADTIWWSDGARLIFGETPPDSSGLEWWSSRLHPEERDRVVRGMEKVAEEGKVFWTDEYRFRHADGSWRILTDRGLYLYNDQGAAVRMIGAMSDITARREAEQAEGRLQRAIQAAADDWTATFDAVPMMILVLDGEHRVHRLNRAARDAMGAPWKDLLHRVLAEVPGEPWAAAAAACRDALQTGAPRVVQVDQGRGGLTWNVVAAPMRTSSGGEVVLVIRDTTELVDLQRNLARERTMSALGALVAGVAHEVRNPLFAISATLDAFEARFGKEPESARYTGNLRPEVERLSTLMRDLLEYGRPAELRPVLADLGRVVRETLARSEGAAATRAIRLEARIPEGGLVARHDPARLQQVIQNLVDNALVHAPASSRIVVAVDQEWRGTQPWSRLTVEDEGPGFRAEDLPHVFEPFYSKRRGGTGLGLSIVERLIEQHGGQVVAENRAEGGARVTVHLPLT